jgi:ATP-binding cassette, subfamily B, bacterial
VTGDRADEPSVRRQVGRVVALVWGERRLYLPGCAFIAFSIATGLTYPLVIRWIIDDGIQGGRVDRLDQLALILVAILLGEAISTCARDYCFNLGAERVAARLRRDTIRTLLVQDIEFFDRRDAGELTTRLWADVPPLQFVLGEEFADALRFAVIAIAGTASKVRKVSGVEV